MVRQLLKLIIHPDDIYPRGSTHMSYILRWCCHVALSNGESSEIFLKSSLTNISSSHEGTPDYSVDHYRQVRPAEQIFLLIAVAVRLVSEDPVPIHPAYSFASIRGQI